MTKRIYLAGPEVFLANAREIGARKRAICERHGLVGVFPADEEDACDPALPLAEQGLAISRAMERVMRGCDAMIVNLTPFRGPSADVGSAYEMGFMRALGRPIFAYTNDAPAVPRSCRRLLWRRRARASDRGTRGSRRHGDRAVRTARQPHARRRRHRLRRLHHCRDLAHAERYTSLAAFERCVAHAAAELLRQAATTRK